MTMIYCLVPKSYWEQWEGRDHYLPRDYEQEGFIHATKGDDLLAKVADRVYATYEGELLVLVVDEAKSSSPVKYEQAKDGLLYPHIYGPLNQDAIVDVKSMVRTNGHWALGASVR
ncbi:MULTISPECIES: DUF952 domain-containing protein [Brevibacillus]|jgi:uncharacterized protein (DUF952 family)|uniref:Uncharacterized conserved protein, DUF952 family n=2 Tax=Brevibacillus TaxID=55080 RepID=A0A1I3PKN8_9BACL|nr:MULTISPECIES: DUF952 domain-containing protein [Brevibacillus]MEC2133005.1 DUF952 domain-containing protein [Brevibacillus centrosporus]MED1949426.1 DUF952 domain-containing protein [Brevibacillus centrosporus]MED4910830.1 DUF952 domain-containing protein [Brevibacillus centrosporus]RNB73486.1 DUF952 domain-containing protein [Brevibacillus centrosporus]RNB88348.1 DUF952 domain-containing protein [Brevibacillus nitrificans]